MLIIGLLIAVRFRAAPRDVMYLLNAVALSMQRHITCKVGTGTVSVGKKALDDDNQRAPFRRFVHSGQVVALHSPLRLPLPAPLRLLQWHITVHDATTLDTNVERWYADAGGPRIYTGVDFRDAVPDA
jgi:hypothetical protein